MKKNAIGILIITIIGCVSFMSFDVTVQAKPSDLSVIGKSYEFKNNDEYNFSKTKKYKTTQDGKNSFGKFSVNGRVEDVTNTKGITTLKVTDQNLKLSYTYSDTLLNAKESDWHLVEDDINVVNDIELDDEIDKGALILQTSKDGKRWNNETVKLNAFSDKPTESKSFYSTNDIQLTNGTYYRVIVAYKTARKKGTEKVFGLFSRDKYEYKKYAEIYEFYAINKDASLEKNHENRFLLGKKQKVDSEGYWKSSSIDKDDEHYGWDLGNFFVSGYTSKVDDKAVFLKNTQDKVTLWFRLNQNIEKLNDNEELSITSDCDGYDQYFETPRTDFGRGTLIIRHTDSENVIHQPQIYRNFLVANSSTGVDTKVQLFEEGDYEVALNYAIEHDDKILGILPNSEESHYRIFFKFSIRNGNCIVFPVDLKTGGDLANEASAESGFYLDYAMSKYLDVNVKKEVMNEGLNGLVEDVYFNRPAKDGEKYTDEGVYTITTKNVYTNQVTEKKIYVGSDEIMKVYTKTGLSIDTIKQQIENGAKVNDDGTLNVIKTIKKDYESNSAMNKEMYYVLVVSMVLIIGSFFLFLKKRKENIIRNISKESDEE